MSFGLFEILASLIVVLTLGAMAATRERGGRVALALDYAVLAVAAWIGEESCVALYRFYAYADGWHVHVDLVPILVPLIWPLVVLSARAVAPVVAPRAGPLARAAVAGAIVVFDASLVEVVAVRAGLWSWAEPGHLGVPVIGILGWGFFAFGALAVIERSRPAVLVAGPVAAHVLIQLAWWGCFRWFVRGALGPVGFVLLGAGAVAFAIAAIRARVAGRTMPPATWGPRVLAAVLFVGLLATTAPTDGALWLHAAFVAVPYLVITGA